MSTGVIKENDLVAAMRERTQGLTVSELAFMLAVPETRVRTWIKDHGLPFYSAGRVTRVRWPDALNWYVRFKSPGQRRLGKSTICENCGHGRTIPD